MTGKVTSKLIREYARRVVWMLSAYFDYDVHDASCLNHDAMSMFFFFQQPFCDMIRYFMLSCGRFPM